MATVKYTLAAGGDTSTAIVRELTPDQLELVVDIFHEMNIVERSYSPTMYVFEGNMAHEHDTDPDSYMECDIKPDGTCYESGSLDWNKSFPDNLAERKR